MKNRWRRAARKEQQVATGSRRNTDRKIVERFKSCITRGQDGYKTRRRWKPKCHPERYSLSCFLSQFVLEFESISTRQRATRLVKCYSYSPASFLPFFRECIGHFRLLCRLLRNWLGADCTPKNNEKKSCNYMSYLSSFFI